MTKGDEWWMREFPPHSRRRLTFFIAWIAVVSLVLHVIGNSLLPEDFRLPIFWISFVTSSVMVGVVWWMAREQAAGKAGVRDRARYELPRQADAASAFLISLIGMGTVAYLAEDSLSFVSAGLAVVGAGLVTFALVFRDSWKVLFAISAVLGLGLAFILRIFLTFIADDGSLLVYWLLSTALVFTTLVMFWGGSMTTRRDVELSVPSWVLALLSSVMLIVGGIAARAID